METMECIQTRRSVRTFTAAVPSREVVEQLVAAAAYAPSWKNTQVTRYIVVAEETRRTRLAEECMLGFALNQKTVRGAPLIVAVTMVEKRSGYERDGSFSTSQGTHWESFDTGIAAQTFCLAAHDAGLGTVIMGVFDEKKVAEVLEIPEGQRCAALIALGYPDETPICPKRKTVGDLLSYR